MRKIYALLIGLVAIVAAPLAAEQLNDNWQVTFTERFRLVTYDNTISLNDNGADSRAFTRHRTQLGAVWSPSSTWSFGLAFGNEFRYYTVPARTDFHLDEVFVDQLYFRAERPADFPLTITLGRQNIMLGEGFIVFDGTPLDGSRSVYFNAARVDWEIRPKKLLTAFVAHTQQADSLLPIINDQDRALVEQPELGLGLYFSGEFPAQQIDLYLIHKRREATASRPVDIATTALGGRAALLLSRQLDLRYVVEVAGQFGSDGGLNRRALGGYQYLTCRPDWSTKLFLLPSQGRVGTIYYSGDVTRTETREDWDPMFARWPKWSDSYIYTLIRENGVAWWSNLISVYGSVTFGLGARLDLRLDYHHLLAPRSGNGDHKRGSLVIGKLSYTLDKRWSGHIVWEGFEPGRFYEYRADSYAWIRAEVFFKY